VERGRLRGWKRRRRSRRGTREKRKRKNEREKKDKQQNNNGRGRSGGSGGLVGWGNLGGARFGVRKQRRDVRGGSRVVAVLMPSSFRCFRVECPVCGRPSEKRDGPLR
jgi:hypothetical protein